MLRLLFLCLLQIAAATCAAAQGVGVGYLNLDRLYDTIPSPFYDDTSFTPTGEHHWTRARYERKISNSAALLDSLSLPIIGLYGVETEAVVRDIVDHSQLGYNYVHRTISALDGMDFALLYFGDQLHVEQVATQRNIMVVEAEMLEREMKVTIIITRDGGDLVDYVRNNPPRNTLIVIGRINSSHLEALGLADPLAKMSNKGFGNCYSPRRGWWMGDRIGVSRALKILKSGVYLTPWLLYKQGTQPLPTFDKEGYRGGFGNYLPIFSYII